MPNKHKAVTDRTKRKHWAEKVFKRDKHTCKECGATENLHAHHIVEWAADESKRFILSNGITLCDNCHKAVHNYGINDKQKLFCLEYLKDFNATRAYMEVYNVTEKVAAANSSRMLRNAKVIEFLNAKRAKLTDEKEITVGWVLSGIKKVGDNELAKDSDRLRAYELGGKYKKVFTDRTESTTITYDISQLPALYLKRIADGENYINVIADYEHSVKSN